MIPLERHKLEEVIKMDVKGYGVRLWTVYRWRKIG
jgi:hypothetical protein